MCGVHVAARRPRSKAMQQSLHGPQTEQPAKRGVIAEHGLELEPSVAVGDCHEEQPTRAQALADQRERLPERGVVEVLEHLGGDHDIQRTLDVAQIDRLQRLGRLPGGLEDLTASSDAPLVEVHAPYVVPPGTEREGEHVAGTAAELDHAIARPQPVSDPAQALDVPVDVLARERHAARQCLGSVAHHCQNLATELAWRPETAHARRRASRTIEVVPATVGRSRDQLPMSRANIRRCSTSTTPYATDEAIDATTVPWWGSRVMSRVRLITRPGIHTRISSLGMPWP